MCVMVCMQRSEENLQVSVLFFNMWVLGLKLMLSASGDSIFTHRDISLAHFVGSIKGLEGFKIKDTLELLVKKR